MAKDTNPRDVGSKTNDVPPYDPIPANPAPKMPTAKPFTESPHVPQTKAPRTGGGSKVSPKIRPSR